jgi:DNA-binding response OmpR family regulator
MRTIHTLIVDDNRHMRVILREALRAVVGGQIYEAGDGAEALETLKSAPCDLVVTDLMMKPIDGVDFVRMLRSSPDSPNPFVPVIMVTGHTSRSRILAARDAGVDELLVKPVTSAALIERIRFVIEDRREFVKTKTFFGPCRRRFRGVPKEEAPQRRAADQGDPPIAAARR